MPPRAYTSRFMARSLEQRILGFEHPFIYQSQRFVPRCVPTEDVARTDTYQSCHYDKSAAGMRVIFRANGRRSKGKSNASGGEEESMLSTTRFLSALPRPCSTPSYPWRLESNVPSTTNRALSSRAPSNLADVHRHMTRRSMAML